MNPALLAQRMESIFGRKTVLRLFGGKLLACLRAKFCFSAFLQHTPCSGNTILQREVSSGGEGSPPRSFPGEPGAQAVPGEGEGRSFPGLCRGAGMCSVTIACTDS